MSEFRYMDRVHARENALPPPAPERAGLPAPRASGLARLMGGAPLAVLARLILLSFLVGAALAWLDIRPAEALRLAQGLLHRVWAFGFDGVREGAGYVAAGALIVAPLWLLSRLFGRRA